MNVVEFPSTSNTECNTSDLEEKIATYEKNTADLNNKLNQRDAELKICYANIVLLIIVIVLMISFKIVKNIKKAN